METRLQQGLDPSGKSVQKKVSIQQATDDFLSNLKTDKRRKKTSSKYKGQFKKFIAFAATQGIREMSEVDLSLMDRFRAARVSKVSDRTMNNDGRALKTFFGWSAKRHYIPTNPLADTKFPRPKYQPRGGPNLDEINQILEIAPPALMPVIAALAFTGRRSSEIEHLRPEDIDFAGNWVHIVSRPDAPTKTGNSGKGPMHPRLRQILEPLPKPKGNLFFTAPPSVQFPLGGNHFNMKRANEEFQKLLKRLKIPAGKKSGGYVLHSLRSSFKIISIHAGIPREVVDQWQDHVGDRRPTASDLYYRLSDEDSQMFMLKVPFGDGIPAANAGNQEKKECVQ